MRRVKRPAVRIACFPVVLLIALYTLTYLAKPDGYNLRQIAGLYGEKERTLDMVYIGSSEAFAYFAPLTAWEEYGVVAYDYAADTVQLELYRTMIEEVLKTQSPQLIVLDARPIQYRDKDAADALPPAEVPYRNTLTGMRLSKNKAAFIDAYAKSIEGAAPITYYFDLLKYHDNLASPNAQFLPMMFGAYRHPYRGFYLEASVETVSAPDARTSERETLPAETAALLEDLLAYLDGIDVEVLFVVAPYAETAAHKRIYNEAQATIDARGYRFLDCNEYADEMGLDYATDFYNADHVNIYGVEKFTAFCCAYMREYYDLPDRRDDPAYAFMNEGLEDWKRAVAETKAEIDRLLAR